MWVETGPKRWIIGVLSDDVGWRGRVLTLTPLGVFDVRSTAMISTKRGGKVRGRLRKNPIKFSCGYKLMGQLQIRNFNLRALLRPSWRFCPLVTPSLTLNVTTETNAAVG